MLALALASAAGLQAAGPPGPLRLAVPTPERVADPTETGPRVLRVEPGASARVAARVEAAGGRVLAVLADDALLVDGRFEAVGAVGDSLHWSGRQALLPALAGLSQAEALRFASGVPVVAAFSRPDQLAAARAGLEAAGAGVVWSDERSRLAELGMRIPPSALDDARRALLEADGLVWTDLVSGARLRNNASIWRCQSGIPGLVPLSDAGLDGAGEVIAVIDTGLDADHCMFSDRVFGLPAVNGRDGLATSPGHRKVLAVDFLWHHDWPDPGAGSWDDQGHGTHVAGSAAGDDGQWGVHDGVDGMAPAAKLVIQDGGATVDDCADLPGLGCPLAPLTPVLAQARAQGARIHTNSWGDEENFRPSNGYTERTAEIDRFVWEHPDAVVLVAAGNSGDEGDGSVGSPATGKNVIAVGATLHGSASLPCVANFSSRGWTDDGRIKPDLVTPGTSVHSAASDRSVATANCAARTASGTSMATPTAAGLAALVRQFYREGRAPDGRPEPTRGREPSAALVRATLVASAVDVSTFGCTSARPIPSPDQGWGLVQLDTALPLEGGSRRLLAFDGVTPFADLVRTPVAKAVVLAADGPLKVVLAWSDPPSTAAATTHLVNDLDLVVEGPDGRFLGNVLSLGQSSGGGESDRLNNLEVVWLPRASAGAWTVRVAPHAIRWGTQPFALVVTGQVASAPPRRATGRAGGQPVAGESDTDDGRGGDDSKPGRNERTTQTRRHQEARGGSSPGV